MDVILAPLLALFCGALPMWWPDRSDPILAFMKLLAVCLALSLYAGGAEGLAIAMMFVLPTFLIGLFGIVAHLACQPWDGRG